MDENGETSIRIDRVLADSGASRGSLYHFFGSREGLVKAALVERFVRSITRDFVHVAEGAANATTAADLVTLVDRELERLGSAAMKEERRRRMNALGAAVYRPEVIAEIAAIQGQLLDGADETMAKIQRQGLAARGINPRAFTLWMLGVLLGRYLLDLDGDPSLEASWVAIARTGFLAVLGIDPSS